MAKTSSGTEKVFIKDKAKLVAVKIVSDMAVRKLDQEFDEAIKTATDDASIDALVAKLETDSAAIYTKLTADLATETAKTASNVALVSTNLRKAVNDKIKAVKVQAELTKIIIQTENVMKKIGAEVGKALTVIKSDTEAAAVLAKANTEATEIKAKLEKRVKHYIEEDLPRSGVDATVAAAYTTQIKKS